MTTTFNTRTKQWGDVLPPKLNELMQLATNTQVDVSSDGTVKFYRDLTPKEKTDIEAYLADKGV